VLQFVTGFVVALLIAMLTLAVRKKIFKPKRPNSARLKEFEELGRLTGELAHEIKNPLSTIKVNLKLAAEDLEGSDLAETGGKADYRLARAIRKIAVIQKEADRLEQILNGFLRYVNKPQLQFADVDVNGLVGDMIDFYSPQAYSHSITIRQGLHSGPIICKIDADVLKQALLNLFINAQQAMDKGGGELIIRTSIEDKNAVIQIGDTGEGIAADRLPRIFDACHSFRPQGSGLGLPTTKRIVEEHDGTISVSSEPGKGTLFTIKLPLSQAGK
jgi:signal transduction histidine kinase